MRRTRIQSVELVNVSHTFEDGHQLFKDISIKLELGRNLVFDGAPGCGRSILLKTIAGLVDPTGGEVLYNGLSLKEISFEEFAPMRLSTTFCFDDGGMLMNKTMIDNIKLGLLYHKGWRSDRSENLCKELIESFGLGPFLHLRPAMCPASVRKMAGLVRSFLHNAQILFLDEPSLGIGDNGLKALNYWIKKYREDGKSDELIVMASSDERFIKNVDADHWVINNGIVVPGSTMKVAA